VKPGDLIRCQTCGTEAVAYTTGEPSDWREGQGLMVSWRGRQHVAFLGLAPALCPDCKGAASGRPPEPWRASSRRNEIINDLCVNGCRLSGFEWNTDQSAEDAYLRWVTAGRPRCALIEIHPLPGARPAPAISAPLAAAERPKSAGQLSLFG
jgi:hypothetical protein